MPSSTTTHHQPKYIRHHSPPPNKWTKTQQKPKYIHTQFHKSIHKSINSFLFLENTIVLYLKEIQYDTVRFKFKRSTTLYDIQDLIFYSRSAYFKILSLQDLFLFLYIRQLCLLNTSRVSNHKRTIIDHFLCISKINGEGHARGEISQQFQVCQLDFLCCYLAVARDSYKWVSYKKRWRILAMCC